MKPTRKSTWILILTAVLIFTQACAMLAVDPSPTPPVEATIPVPPAESPTTEPAPSETPVPDPAASCPTPSSSSSLYLSRENGFCFLYPVGFSLEPDSQRPDEAVTLIGPVEPGTSMERIRVTLHLAYNGPADGLDSSGYAQRWFELYTAGSGISYSPAAASIGGQAAVILNNIPGYITQRGAFLVANGIKYQILLLPLPGDIPALDEPTNQVWDTVTSTLVFFPPENDRVARRAADVCPAPGADTRLYQSDMDGYCFLYPAGFEPTADFPGQIAGGPVVLNDESFGDVRTSLTMGTFGSFPGQTPREVLGPRSDTIDSLEDASFGGHPAVIFRSTAGPWASKQAMILVDGFAYTIVAQPFEPERYPAGMPYLNQLWDVVTGSLAFFDPFR
jgi:hypothetical protein